jgi:hypothetical protein
VAGSVAWCERQHGPWIDLHGHSGRCLLAGLPAGHPMAAALAAESVAGVVRAAVAAGVTALTLATVSLCCRLRSGVIVQPCLLSRAVLKLGRTALTRSLRSALPTCAAPGRNRGAWHTPFTAIVKMRCGWSLSSTGPTLTRYGHISGCLHRARSCKRSRPSPLARPSFRSTRRAHCPCKGGRPARRRCTAGRASPARTPVHLERALGQGIARHFGDAKRRTLLPRRVRVDRFASSRAGASRCLILSRDRATAVPTFDFADVRALPIRTSTGRARLNSNGGNHCINRRLYRLNAKATLPQRHDHLR